MAVVVPKRFKRAMRRKAHDQRVAILECVDRVADNPHHPGLHTHPVQGQHGVWEAYVDEANRVTFEYDEGHLVFLNNCNHDMLRASPR